MKRRKASVRIAAPRDPPWPPAHHAGRRALRRFTAGFWASGPCFRGWTADSSPEASREPGWRGRTRGRRTPLRHQLASPVDAPLGAKTPLARAGVGSPEIHGGDVKGGLGGALAEDAAWVRGKQDW